MAGFGYLVQVQGVRGWPSCTDTAVHAAVGCILLGLGLTGGVWRQGKVHPTWAPRWGIALAELYVSLYHSSQAMIWVDPSLHVRWVAPLTGNETAQDFDLGFEEQRRQTLELVGGKRTATITRALGFSSDAAGFQVSVPP
jgi:hypothetical protein